jgi:hypothetical protein
MKYLLVIALALFFGCKKSDSSVQEVMGKPADSVTKAPIALKECDADFESFFKKFAADSVYQMKHIKFPLKDSYLSDDYSETVTDYIELKDCKYFDFRKDEDAYKKETGAYTVKVEKKQDTVSYNWRGVDNGIYIDFKFVFTNGCWQMVEISDNST